jgi:hypothetical protein
MDYSIFSEKLVSLSAGTLSVVAELVASSSETVPYYSAISDRLLLPGSVAIVPSESAIYILDTDLLWTEWGTGEKLPAPENSEGGET